MSLAARSGQSLVVLIILLFVLSAIVRWYAERRRRSVRWEFEFHPVTVLDMEGDGVLLDYLSIGESLLRESRDMPRREVVRQMAIELCEGDSLLAEIRALEATADLTDDAHTGGPQ